MDNTVTRGVFLAFARVHVLHHAAEGPVFRLSLICIKQFVDRFFCLISSRTTYGEHHAESHISIGF